MISSAEIADMTFRCLPSVNISDHSKNLQVFNLLMAIDGKRSVATIAREDAYDLESLTGKINQLLQMNLIEAVGGAGASMPKTLIAHMASELSAFVGPMAGVLIDECAGKMGHTTNDFPPAKAQTLIEEIAVYIQPKAKADEFKARMSAKITAAG